MIKINICIDLDINRIGLNHFEETVLDLHNKLIDNINNNKDNIDRIKVIGCEHSKILYYTYNISNRILKDI
jgi:hypothetical protein